MNTGENNEIGELLIWIFTHLKLCLAYAIHNFKWVKILSNRRDWETNPEL